MRQATNNTELYIGIRSFCKRFNLSLRKLRHSLVSCRTRYYRFNNARYVEINNLIEVLKSNPERFGDQTNLAIDYLETLV